MPISQMRNGLTAENSIFSQKPSIKVPRSKFDYGRLNLFTSDIGMIVPVDLIPTLPNEDYDLSCQYKIDFRPLLVPSLTSYKVKVHYYYCPNSYLWQGWESFISKGRSGNLALTVPTIKLSELNPSYGMSGVSAGTLNGLTDSALTSATSYYPATPHSLISYLVGSCPYSNPDASLEYLPFGPVSDSNKLTKTNVTGFKLPDVNALPFLMYQKIYRSNYIDPNLYSNGYAKSDVWFPDDIDSSLFRFSYTANNLFGDYLTKFVPINTTAPTTVINNFVPKASTVEDTSGDNCIELTQLRYSMYTDDMFTTALPFLQRGEQTQLDIVAQSSQFLDLVREDTSKLGMFSNNNFGAYSNPPSISSSEFSNFGFVSPSQSNDGTVFMPSALSSGTSSYYPLFSNFTKNANYQGMVFSNVKNVGVSLNGVKFNSAFTAQQLRSLIALSVWQERNALTNGSYGQFVKVHYDEFPKNQFCEPVYIGGTTSLFNVSAVVQTSASQDGSTPQGNPSGIGGSSNSNSIGKFHSSDFGYIMALMTIIPDTVYTQTVDHHFFETTPDDFYSPEFEQLSYQPILNKQLVVTGSESDDNNLFGYSNRYVYLKSRDSVARGMLSLPASVDAYYHSYVQSRSFASTPRLSQQFVTAYPPNIDRSMLAYPGSPAFICQFYSGVSVVKPLSYVAKPNNFGF